jgi:hypothetical protein
LNTFSISSKVNDIASLADGVSLTEALNSMCVHHRLLSGRVRMFAHCVDPSDSAHFSTSSLKRNVGDNWLLKLANLKNLMRDLQSFYSSLGKDMSHAAVDINKIAYAPASCQYIARLTIEFFGGVQSRIQSDRDH